MGLEKMTITAYKTEEYQAPTQGTFKVLINPESYKEEMRVSYAEEQGQGTSGAQLRFKYIPSSQISLKLIFDGTNLITTAPTSLKGKTVGQQIEAFQKVTTDYSGSIHQPFFLELSWGNMSFRGVLTELSIEYKLFKPDGTALRAEANATFKTSSQAQEDFLAKKKNSPDLSHVVQVKASDRLPNLCNEIYSGTNYYIQVAKKNKLNHFRNIPNGKRLIFPPIKNQ